MPPLFQAFGSITVSWLFVQALIGAGSVWFGGAAFGGGHKAKLVWKYHRLSGYFLLPFLLTTVHLAGAWSSWMSAKTVFVVRLVVYTLAPLGILASVYSRIRCGVPSMICRNPFDNCFIQTVKDEILLDCELHNYALFFLKQSLL